MIETKCGTQEPDRFTGLKELHQMTPEEIEILRLVAELGGGQDYLAAIEQLRRWPMSYLSDEEIGLL